MDKTTFQGRLLHVLPGRAKPGQEGAVAGSGVVDGKVLGKRDEGRGEVKSKVDAKRKQESTKGVNWASLYMNVSFFLLLHGLFLTDPILERRCCRLCCRPDGYVQI